MPYANDLCGTRQEDEGSAAACELLPLRDLPQVDNVMVRTNGAFVAGYELKGVLSYFATDEDRNQAKSMLEALIRGVPDVSMRIQIPL